jgi:hypothetical protein
VRSWKETDKNFYVWTLTAKDGLLVWIPASFRTHKGYVMNTAILRKVMILVVLLAGYVSVMGACCQECCGQPDYTTKCNNESGFCLQGDCIPGDPPPRVNRCAGLNEGDPCKVSDELTGTCVVFGNVLSCLVIVELPAP